MPQTHSDLPMSALLSAALEYAKHGWYVVPLRARGKEPRVLDWVNEASCDPEQIRAWWRRWPDSNIGIACGRNTGLDVLDIDGDEGAATLAALEAEHGPIPATFEVSTRNGRHLYFWANEDVRNSVKNLEIFGPGVDTRAQGGQVVAPPSIHPEGHVYAWRPGHSPRELEAPTSWPPWVIQRFVAYQEERRARPEPRHTVDPVADGAQRYARAALEREVADLAEVGQGGRNDALNRASFNLGQLVGAGALDEYEVWDRLLEACERNGLLEDDGRRQCEKTIRSGVQGGRQQPRAIPEPRYARSREPSAPRPNASPPFEDPPPPDGPDDYMGGGDDGDGDDLPEIINDTKLARMVREADYWLSQDPELFQRGNLLVQVLRDSAPLAGEGRTRQAPRIGEIRPQWLAALSTRRVRWIKRTWKAARGNREGYWEMTPCRPPRDVIGALYERGHWEHVRHLEGVSVCPILRPDGTVLEEPGYDPLTGVLYEPLEQFPPIPEQPDELDAEAALERLCDVVCDFPFESVEHKAAWVAATLTPLARYAFRGPSPLFLFDANTPGAGKGKLANVTSEIGIGAVPAVMVHTRDESEERKRITSYALESEPVVLIDNVEGTFGSSAMCVALTSDTWSDRILGGSRTYKGPLTTTWLMTANNVQLTTDMVRRTCHIRLNVDEERPEERTGFRYPHLEQHVRRHRPQLVAAALTMLRAYCVAGRPDQGLPSWGSFEGWSALVRQAVVFAGMPDPGKTRENLRAVANLDSDALTDFVNALHEHAPEGAGKTVGNILAMARDHEELRDALHAFGGQKALASAKSLGWLLRKHRNRIVDGKAIAGEKDDHRKQWVWWVRRTERTADA